MIIYDPQTRSLLQTDYPDPGVSSQQGAQLNSDGSADIYFGPTAPEGKESNWIQTVPGEAWFAYFRLYEPLQEFFDRSWVLSDIEKASW